MELFKFTDLCESFHAVFGTEYDYVYKTYLWVYLLVGGLLFAMMYTFKAFALYTVAKRNGYGKCWMAFVPFVNTYYIGVVSDKNKIFRSKARSFSLALAITEGVLFAITAVYYVATLLIFEGGYAEPVNSTYKWFYVPIQVVERYNPKNVPANLEWAWWIFDHSRLYFVDWIELGYLVLNVLVLMNFFRTYSSKKYVLFTIICIIFPVSGLIMYFVRNNAGRNYGDYIREQQRRQYEMYRDYYRNNPDNYQGGGYQGGYQNGYRSGTPSDPTGRPGRAPSEDPFGGLGKPSEGDGSDPFDDL